MTRLHGMMTSPLKFCRSMNRRKMAGIHGMMTSPLKFCRSMNRRKMGGIDSLMTSPLRSRLTLTGEWNESGEAPKPEAM